MIGRGKASRLRQIAQREGWLDTRQPLPTDTILSAVLHPEPDTEAATPSSSQSSVEPYRQIVTAWWEQGIR